MTKFLNLTLSSGQPLRIPADAVQSLESSDGTDPKISSAMFADIGEGIVAFQLRNEYLEVKNEIVGMGESARRPRFTVNAITRHTDNGEGEPMTPVVVKMWLPCDAVNMIMGLDGSYYGAFSRIVMSFRPGHVMPVMSTDTADDIIERVGCDNKLEKEDDRRRPARPLNTD